MSYLSCILSGLVQGFTEFLPISSSGHLCILDGISGEAADFTFDVLLHLATLAAVLIVYRRDIASLTKAGFTLSSKLIRRAWKTEPLTQNERLAVNLILATLPMAFAVILDDRAEALFSDVRFVGAMLIVNAAVLLLCDRVRFRFPRSADKLTAARSLCIGCFQLCAVVPGLSRSGMTVTGGRCMGLDRENAVRMSFLMSIPVILCANLAEAADFITAPEMLPYDVLLPYLAGMACAFVSGLLSIRLLRYIAGEKHSFRIFSIYCALLGIITLLFA